MPSSAVDHRRPRPNLTVAEARFGSDGIDFAMPHKIYQDDNGETETRHSPAVRTAIDKPVICGEPNDALTATSYLETTDSFDPVTDTICANPRCTNRAEVYCPACQRAYCPDHARHPDHHLIDR